MHLPDVYQGYTCEEAGQTAKERNTRLEVAKHPASYYRVDRRLNTPLVYSDGPYGKKP